MRSESTLASLNASDWSSLSSHKVEWVIHLSPSRRKTWFSSVRFHNALSLRLVIQVCLIIMKHPHMSAFKCQCIQQIWPEDYDNEQRSLGLSQRPWARGGLQKRIGRKIKLPHLFKTSERSPKPWISGTLLSHACAEEQFRGARTHLPHYKQDFHTCIMHVLHVQMFLRLTVFTHSCAAPIHER